MAGEEKNLSARILEFAEGNEVQDAAAGEDDAQSAETEGNQGEESDGLDTASEEDEQSAETAEDDADESEQSQEPDEGTEEKGTKKKSFEERIAEVEAKLRAEMEAKYKAIQDAASDKPDFVEVDLDKVNAWIKKTEDEIEDLKLEGNLLEAKKKERSINQLLAEIDANDKKREEFFRRQNEKKAGTTQTNERLQKVEQAADFYRNHKGIDQAAWDKMGEWFAARCQADPLIGKMFAEKVDTLGPLESVMWAHEYTAREMSKDAQKTTEKKEQSKTKAAAIGAPAGGTGGTSLADAKKAYDANPNEETYARYMTAKRSSKAA